MAYERIDALLSVLVTNIGISAKIRYLNQQQASYYTSEAIRQGLQHVYVYKNYK